MDKIYVVEDGKFQSKEVDGRKVDAHCHSKYSNKFLQEWVTRLIGVRECYTSPGKLYKTLKKKGVDFFTITDHDVIEGALELRYRRQTKEFYDSFVSCEYTVPLEPKDYSQFIHVLCPGIDYPAGIFNPLPDPKVRQYHGMLKRFARLGRREFYKFCEGEGLIYIPAHSALTCTPKKPISGEQFVNIVTGRDISGIKGPQLVEINSDLQRENLIDVDVAQRNNLAICCGTDAHTSIRLGNQFTVTKYPVKTAAEFLLALRKGDVGIGSSFSMPASVENPSIADVMFYQFNGTIEEFQKDTIQGEWNYFLHEWGWRKFTFLAGYLFIPAVVSVFCGHYLGIESVLASAPTLLGLETLASAVLLRGLPIKGRIKSAKRARKLYESYMEYLAYLDTAAQRNDLQKIKEEMKGLEEIVKAKQEEIDKIRNSYVKKELPIFNPTLRGFNDLSLRWVEKLFPGDFDICDTQEFTNPINNDDDNGINSMDKKED